MRIGQGVDAHRLVSDRPLVLGGIEVEFDFGLAAHSDGDVLLHAICDALLGAGGLGDIGHHFPDTDAAYAGIDSRLLLRQVHSTLAERGWSVGNVDATIIAQRPRLASHLPAMIECIAADLQVDPTAINLKATTLEWMGFTGRGEGIAATAVAMIECP
ncbi:2-C-methyl-D-erythritol 2,4-cyclodiphosphate synthase [Spiribacter vilamensis]|nr:2-C-methyl-D-erythritol 2,4-cyclodiphosphate synthase [Spiribacter vilamensis]